MLISIITPTFNSEKNIEKCVLSIINQTNKNFEHIIVDNLSTDSTLQKVKDLYSSNNLTPKLRIISEKDDGISDAFNKGIETATGDIITILNSDDYYFSNNIFEKIIYSFKNLKILFVHGNILFQDNLYGTNIRKPLLCDVRKAMPYNHPTMFLRRDLYTRIGLFETKYKYAMDFDLVVRLQKIIGDPDLVSIYLKDEPLVVMNAGGASWKNEIISIKETKQILINHKFWDNNAKMNYLLRLLRTKVKKILNLTRMNIIVMIWRKWKWIT
jgi:glycosyltransferase